MEPIVRNTSVDHMMSHHIYVLHTFFSEPVMYDPIIGLTGAMVQDNRQWSSNLHHLTGFVHDILYCPPPKTNQGTTPLQTNYLTGYVISCWIRSSMLWLYKCNLSYWATKLSGILQDLDILMEWTQERQLGFMCQNVRFFT